MAAGIEQHPAAGIGDIKIEIGLLLQLLIDLRMQLALLVLTIGAVQRGEIDSAFAEVGAELGRQQVGCIHQCFFCHLTDVEVQLIQRFLQHDPAQAARQQKIDEEQSQTEAGPIAAQALAQAAHERPSSFRL